MFGANSNPNQQGNQVPYEVYETVHEPEARRRRWLIRLGVALVVATLLTFGGVQAYRALHKPAGQVNQTTQNSGGQSGEANKGTGKPQEGAQPASPSAPSNQGGSSSPNSVTQSPQQNKPLPASGSASENETPVNTTSNNSIVRKPE